MNYQVILFMFSLCLTGFNFWFFFYNKKQRARERSSSDNYVKDEKALYTSYGKDTLNTGNKIDSIKIPVKGKTPEVLPKFSDVHKKKPAELTREDKLLLAQDPQYLAAYKSKYKIHGKVDLFNYSDF